MAGALHPGRAALERGRRSARDPHAPCLGHGRRATGRLHGTDPSGATDGRVCVRPVLTGLTQVTWGLRDLPHDGFSMTSSNKMRSKWTCREWFQSTWSHFPCMARNRVRIQRVQVDGTGTPRCLVDVGPVQNSLWGLCLLSIHGRIIKVVRSLNLEGTPVKVMPFVHDVYASITALHICGKTWLAL